ncbi:ATPase [Chromatium okenii]|uniref:ATP synthase subunit C n=1 Tax=Chromatium okenii TaxID=61644 RepID=UPI00190447EF|nr:ATP synthase subunit C [Chromatium okenii]MBK1640317.1 ATPase [Chromatium okenii]
MYWLVALMSLAILGLIISGIALEFRPAIATRIRSWYRPVMSTQLVAFVGAQLGLLFMGVSDAMAQAETIAAVPEMSVGMGLAILGVGIPTGLSTIGAGIAVGPIGAASLAAVMERPEALGRTLIFLGLAEGIAIYGLVMSILLLNRLG